MGLDIYLYKYENFEDTQKRESEYSEKSEALWTKEYENTPESEKELIREKDKELAESLSLGEYGEDQTLKTCIEINSTIDKDHYFKIGYFRSSYNDGGINNVLRNLGVPDLYEIFTPNDEYTFQPNWNTCLNKCNKSIKLLEQKGAYRCFNIAANIFGGDAMPQSEEQALSIFTERIKGKHYFGAYSNKEGHFWRDEPLKVLALMPGETSILKKQPCTYVICEGDNSYYLTALKIVKETIDYVLSQPDKEKYYLHWSG